MSKTTSIIFLKQNTNDKIGTLYLRTIEDRVTRRKSLGVNIKESDWNKYFIKKSNRFKSDKRFSQGNDLNMLINGRLKELAGNDGELSYMPNEKKSFIRFWEKYIESFENYGTRIKHEVVISKLRKYLSSKNKTGLLFVEITPDMLRELRLYLSKTKDPKSLSNNSINHYLKIIKSVLNRAYKDDYFVYAKNPFASFGFKKEDVTKGVLSAGELFAILKTNIEDEDLRIAKDMFIFQIFANGMRVSDLLLLRWNNFDMKRLNYKMFKTSTQMSIPININLGFVLYDRLGSTNRYDNFFKVFEYPVVDEFGNVEKLVMSVIDERIEKLRGHIEPRDDEERAKFDYLIERQEAGTYKGYYFEKANESMIVKLIDAKEELLKHIDDVYLNVIISRIKVVKGKRLTNFVFPILKDSFFEDIGEKNDFSKVSVEQYKALKHASIVYNRRLKKVQQLCKVDTNLTSHVARHSFTNLLLTMKDVNLYDISQSLGHANITITQNYIRSGFNIEKVDNLSMDLSFQFRQK